MMETAMSYGLCRCCASEGSFKDLEKTYDWLGTEEVYADMLKDCFDISLSKQDNYNNGGICEVCITQLRNANNFKKQVQLSEQQFLKKFEDDGYKTSIVKIEVPRPDEHDIFDDGNLSDGFSSPEYDVPLTKIKVEKLNESKPKKRTAKASTSKAKKLKKEEGESSSKRTIRTITIERRKTERNVELRVLKRGDKDRQDALKKNLHNLQTILLNSNANPIRGRDSFGYGCAFCSEQYQDPKMLKKHFLNEHNSDRFIKLMSENIIEHVVKLDITFLNCALCDKDISALDELMVHLKCEHHKEIFTEVRSSIVPFKFDSPELRCAVCTAEYSSFKQLQEHMSSHYGNHVCNLCGRSYMTHKLFLHHMSRHKTDEVKCSWCDKIFSNREKLRGHEKRIHLGMAKRNKCSMCTERFLDYWKKVDHMVKVHGAPPVVLKCQACERTFDNQRALASHTKKDHLLERKHSCAECDMRFFSKSNLTRHMAKHTGVRQYRCDVCFKSYGRKQTLREHMRIHNDDRRFACTHCGQAFVQKCSWRSHMRSKHGEEV